MNDKKKGISFWIGAVFMALFFLGVITILLGLASNHPVSSFFGTTFVYLVISVIFLAIHYYLPLKEIPSYTETTKLKNKLNEKPSQYVEIYSPSQHYVSDYYDYEKSPKTCILCDNRIRGRTKYCSVCRPTGKSTAMPIEERQRKRQERQQQKMDIWQRKEEQKQRKWMNKQFGRTRRTTKQRASSGDLFNDPMNDAMRGLPD